MLSSRCKIAREWEANAYLSDIGVRIATIYGMGFAVEAHARRHTIYMENVHYPIRR
jgi:hypothetical protein